MAKWRFAVDRGGTFTDIIGVDPDGLFHTLKLLSQSPEYEDAAIEGIRSMLGLGSDEPLPEDKIAGIRFGTTVATNALLERKGSRVGLLITKGFRDLLEIGYQSRPDIFSLCIRKTPPLYTDVFEVDERIDSRGKAVRPLDVLSLLEGIKSLRKDVDSFAVVLMHSWINPEHELLCEEIMRGQGLEGILLSHRSANLIKIVCRGQSTLADAYLESVISQYMKHIQNATSGIPVEFMQSSGVLSPPESFSGKNALLSGPAGGVIAASKIAGEAAAGGVIGFDMGGTSTDVSRFDGSLERVYENVIGGLMLHSEMLNINTVAAGGGSVLGFDGQKMTVGPESAGSYPGPACYGFGGPLTITDANLFTGKIDPAYFPETFGPDRSSGLDEAVVEEKFRLLADEINFSLGSDISPPDLAEGFLRVANEKMAMAIREISISQGFDVRNYSLVCLGGAAGQHACSIAALLDMERVIIHPLGSVMSAYGIGLAMPAWKISKTVLMTCNHDSFIKIPAIYREMEKELVLNRPERDGNLVFKRELDLRPKGSETSLTIRWAGLTEMTEEFRARYLRLFGFVPEGIDLEVVSLRAELSEEEDFFPSYETGHGPSHPIPVYFSGPVKVCRVYCDGSYHQAPLYQGKAIPPGFCIKGPALVMEDGSSVVIDHGFEAVKDEKGMIFISRTASGSETVPQKTHGPDPVLLEVFNNTFMGIATEMGMVLRNTAHSVNMKERLDFSCAVFDSIGDLVANAPHIPVHLGSMADTVKAVMEDNRSDMRPGDVYLSNNPYRGGSHLPDMTVVCPVFSGDGELVFFTASRGHHSDVGGVTPGSMPSSASHIEEEGVLADGVLIVRDGVFREEVVRQLLSGHRYPARNIPERVSDFRAQIAACHFGMSELQRLITRYGLDIVTSYMGFIQDCAEYSVKRALQRFTTQGLFRADFEDCLDDGTPVRATISINSGSEPPATLKAIIDFTGTGIQHRDDNLNAPVSVTRSALIYVLRALTGKEIPLNSGCLRPVDIIIPEGCLLNPVYPAPVASGNVETSQRVVDVILGALGVAAASQGTMNNLLFEVEGDPPYYETIGGGSGGMDGCPGASGVQVHMTNTRITDPEVLEVRHGVVLEQFTLRSGSGGRGRFRGGDGIIRRIRFLRPATVSILSERRVVAPYGFEGGGEGKRGVNIHLKKDGSEKILGHREVLKLDAGDSIIIRTPGGGGYGSASDNDPDVELLPDKNTSKTLQCQQDLTMNRVNEDMT